MQVKIGEVKKIIKEEIEEFQAKSSLAELTEDLALRIESIVESEIKNVLSSHEDDFIEEAFYLGITSQHYSEVMKKAKGMAIRNIGERMRR